MLLIILIWALCFGLAFFAPSLSLLLYGLIGADRDGYALLNFMSIFMVDHKLITRAVFLGLYCLSSFIFFRRSGDFQSELRRSVYLAQFLSAFILFGCIVKGQNALQALSVLVFSGLPVYVMWVAFSLRANNAWRFYIFVFVQISIAIAVLIFPFFAFLDGSVYAAREGIGVIEDIDINFSLPDASLTKGLVSKYGNFHNQNALGFYSCAAIAIGLGIMRVNEAGYGRRSFALLLCLGGAFCWLNSLTRLPLLMLLGGVFLVGVLMVRKGKVRKDVTRASAIIIALLGFSVIALSTELLSFLLPESSNVAVTARLVGYVAGLDAVFQHPIFGVNLDWNWPWLGYPHVLPLAFAADYGILGGVLIFVIVFGGGARVIYRALTCKNMHVTNHRDPGLAVYLILVVWGAALSNNLIAPVLFWIAFAEANLTVFPNHSRAKMRPNALNLGKR